MLTTRAAGRDDATVVARLWTAANAARQAEAGLLLGSVVAADLAEAEEQAHRRLANPANFGVLVQDEGEPVAMAIVLQALAQDGASRDPLPGLAHVSMVAVHPERWGRGLGGVVLDLALFTARKRGFTHAQLWTHETNRRAQRLYERLGWAASGRTMIDDRGERIRHYILEL